MTKNTASQVIGAQMVSASDGSAFTGSVTCYVTVDGGTQAVGSVGSGACTHEGGGYHTYTPAQAETNGDLLAFQFRGTGAITTTVQVFTTAWAKSLANVPANVTQFGGSNGTFASGRPEANTTHIAGSAVSTSSAQIGVNVVNAGGTAWATVVTNLVSSIWSATTRILTAGTNIVLAKGTGVTGFTDLDAAGVRTAVGLSSANLDTQLSTIDSVVDDIKAVTDNLPENGALTSIADDVADALAASEAARDRLVAEPITTGEVVSDGGNSSTAIKTDLSETADGHWVGAYLLITSGDLEGQVKRIIGYDGTDKIVTTDAFTSTPADGTAFAIINR